jgi:branched-chain amino acid transport system permease protein
MLVGAAAMIEMVYHLQLNIGARAELQVHGRAAQRPRRRQLVRRALVLALGVALFELTRRQFQAEWGDPGRHREGNQAPGDRM